MKSLVDSIGQVSIFADVLESSGIQLVIQLVDNKDDNKSKIKSKLFRLLAEHVELARHKIVGNAWQDYLLEKILAADNVFTRKAEISGLDNMGSALLEKLRNELDIFESLHNLKLDIPLDGFRPVFCPDVDNKETELKKLLNNSKGWGSLTGKIAEYYLNFGSGEFGRFRAFRWKSTNSGGELFGVESPDSIRLSDLVEYDWQREDVRRNTQKLVSGLPANNMLLYGDRGTGKSSTVKAMLNEFADKKLRIVEVAKESLVDLPRILAILRKRPEKFILFIDDISFEENETQYKALKAVLEGGLEAKPVNVALYATSNRRNIIKERFSDRIKEDDEVHPGDTMQEKLSLSDRFGIKIPFLAPDQDEYLRIVNALMERANIELTEDMRKKALAWQHSRSGRSARQFVDYVIGEIGLSNT